jgi:hypothetical protein
MNYKPWNLKTTFLFLFILNSKLWPSVSFWIQISIIQASRDACIHNHKQGHASLVSIPSFGVFRTAMVSPKLSVYPHGFSLQCWDWWATYFLIKLWLGPQWSWWSEAQFESERFDCRGILAFNNCLCGDFCWGIFPNFCWWNEYLRIIGSQLAGRVFMGTAVMHFLSDFQGDFWAIYKFEDIWLKYFFFNETFIYI